MESKSFNNTPNLEDVDTLEQMLLEENIAVCRIHSELFRYCDVIISAPMFAGNYANDDHLQILLIQRSCDNTVVVKRKLVLIER